MKKNPYRSFDKCVVRTPLLPLSYFKELTKEDNVDVEDLKQTYATNAIIKEAIFLASPTLYERLEKWCSNEITDKKEAEKLVYSLLKYLSRMSSRCTPFGLFAGTGIGSFNERTSIELEPYEKFGRHTRFDMNYLIALSQNLVREPSIKKQLLFYPNSSLYRVGNEWRYIEYIYHNKKRNHQMVSLENDDNLRRIISAAKPGAYLSDLSKLLVDDEITTGDAIAFIDELVSSQLLVSELEPSVSGPEFSFQLTTYLKKLKGIQLLLETFSQANQNLESLDKKLGNPIKSYLKIANSLKNLETKFELKHMFQTDMILHLKENQLGHATIDKALKALTLFNKITPPREETMLSQFGKALYERYENREVPLAKALDMEIGIGYKQNQGSGDVNQLIDDIVTPTSNKNTFQKISLTAYQKILHQKLIESIKLEYPVIHLSDKDFEKFEVNWDDLADTISAMIQVVQEQGNDKLFISGFGGSSSANLLARFCHGDKEINLHTRHIVEREHKMNPNKILAEIVHLPESRVGNILMRPAFRNYEIPYLAKSILPTEKQLSIDDLVISARRDGRVTLRSISMQKEVIPRLSNAHNFSNQSLPIYNFLADLQTQGRRMLGFGWGGLAELYKFLPRVEFEGVILSKAQWTISKKEIENLMLEDTSDAKLKVALKLWKKTYQIPQYVLLIESDNELLINTDNLTAVRMLLNEVKKKARFKLSEFLFGEETIVKQGSNQYTNQMIISFVNTQKQNGHE
ncbi:lantibiotic dehydratase family protein [Roseivirga misakiensis]|nr:lantibiotic dehydratase family protein [Roseivirga misakiensis]